MTKVAVLALLLLIQGCATYTERLCKETSWSEIGESDAKSGLSYKQSFDQYSHGCEAVGVAENEDEYKKGYESGLLKYCRIKNASWHGFSGKLFSPSICPRENIQELELEYYKTLTGFLLKKSVARERQQFRIKQVLNELNKNVDSEVKNILKKKAMKSQILEIERFIKDMNLSATVVREEPLRSTAD